LLADPLICVIDDDASVRRALVGLIASMGYRSCGHASAAESLESGQAEAAAVILTDIQMPGMDGFDLKRALDARGCATPVIMMTGRADGQLEIRALEVGAFCFMRKPLDAKSLAECLERALNGR